MAGTTQPRVTAPELLSKFTPSLLRPETLEAIFVQREDLAADLVASITRATTTKGRHHHLLVGPRGIGKTHLVSIVYHRLMADAKVAKRLRVAWLREESWEVGSFADLLEAMLRALHSEYGDEALGDALASLRGVSDDEAERRAERALADWQGDHLLLLIAENLEDIFEGLGDTGQQRFRAWLQNRRSAVVLATTPSLFEGVSKQTGPFFNFFDVTQLDELTLDEATDLLVKIAELRRDTELADFLRSDTGRRRLKVVEALAGGHPRVWILLSECITTELIDELVPLFIKAMDDLTPYYQSRLKELSRQQRQIVTFLVRGKGAFTVKDIAEGTRQSPKVTGVQIKRLVEVGLVREADLSRFQGKPDRRKRYYELREPLLRLSLDVKESRGRPLRLIVEFLSDWFERPAVLMRLSTVSSDQRIERAHLEAMLASTASRAALADARSLLETVLQTHDSEEAWAALGDLVLAFVDDADFGCPADPPLEATLEKIALARLILLMGLAVAGPGNRRRLCAERAVRGLLAAAHDTRRLGHLAVLLIYSVQAFGAANAAEVDDWADAWQRYAGSDSRWQIPIEVFRVLASAKRGDDQHALAHLPLEIRSLVEPMISGSLPRGDELPQEIDHGAGEVG